MPDYATDRRHAATWAKRLLDGAQADPHHFVIFDTETSGLPQNGPVEILQLGALWPNGSTALDTLVKPCWDGTGIGAIPMDAALIHGINDAMVADAPTLLDLLPQLGELLQARKVLVYNASYDFEVLHGCLVRREIPLAGHPGDPALYLDTERREAADAWMNQTGAAGGRWECVMKWWAKFYGEWNPRRGQYKWQKLPGGTHGALGDCQATLTLLQKMAAEAPPQEVQL
jgi:DNA polymerase III epsilon subunit-like protein